MATASFSYYQAPDCHGVAAGGPGSSSSWVEGYDDAGATRVATQGLQDTALDLYAASKVFCLHLLSFESLFAVATSLVATSAYYYFGDDSGTREGTDFAANISWTIVTFAVVSPMIMQIRQAFTRREQALDAFAESKSLFVNILLAHALWDWGDNGRKKLPADHVSKTKTLLVNMLSSVEALLLLPTLTRGRHRFTSAGRKMAGQFCDSTDQLQLHLVALFRRLHQQVEVMKSVGLPANEASRINQYHWMLHARIEKLLNIKFYRTPQATRSFTRLFILVLPVFFGPYYVYIARGSSTMSTNFGFCLSLSIMTSLLMSGIFNVERLMEDPFRGGGLDGIHVHEIVSMLRRMLDVAYSDSEAPDYSRVPPAVSVVATEPTTVSS